MSATNYGRVKQVFQSAVKLDPADWDAHLDRECAGDVELRAQVAELLRHHREGTVLDLPQDTPPRTRFEFPDPNGEPGEPTEGSSETRRGVRRHRLISIVILVLTLALFGLGVRELFVITERYQQSLRNAMSQIVGLHAELLERWAASKERKLAWVKAPELRAQVDELMAAFAEHGDVKGPELVDAGEGLRSVIAALAPEGSQTEYLLFTPDGEVLATSSSLEYLLGERHSPRGAELYEELREGPQVLPPFRLRDLVRGWPEGAPDKGVVGYADRLLAADQSLTELDAPGVESSGMMLVCEPLSDKFWKGKRASVDTTAADIYAFDDRGVMISASRYEQEPEVRALLAGADGTTLNLSLRDPGGPILAAQSPSAELLGSRPLTRIVRLALAPRESGVASSGVELEGYRSFRGRISVGAWAWIDSLDIGVVLEADREQALSHVRSTQGIAVLLLVLLFLLALAALYSSLAAERLSSKVEAGMELGQYKLLRKIGEGGLGRVFLAQHARLRRLAAVKLIKHELLNEETVLRFEREVQLTCELSHPNTLIVYDYGRSESGTFYYAMEYLPGITLADLIQRAAPMPFGRAIYLLRQLLGSLAEAHGIGLVHRDVKPLNVMVNHMGGEFDLVKVLDFGLAKEVHGDDLELTAEGMVSGTPLYIAPERFDPSGELDARSDLYAVGTIAYQMVTGRAPFDAPTRMELLLMVQHRPAPRASEIEGLEVPAALDDLIHGAMAKAPAHRPKSAAYMASVLEELQREYPWSQAQAAACWESEFGRADSEPR